LAIGSNLDYRGHGGGSSGGGTMNERAALMRAICENSDDDTPRLVFADWLDENAGNLKWRRHRPSAVASAELIRLQCALTKVVKYTREWCEGTKREEELLRAYSMKWKFELYEVEHFSFFLGDEYRRGFIDSAVVTCDDVLFRDAERNFKLTPIQRLEVQHPLDLARLAYTDPLSRLTELTLGCPNLTVPDIEALAASPVGRAISMLRIYHEEPLDSDIGDALNAFFPARWMFNSGR
jgi:uncharacterized protein (TIGR02996 family)